MNRVIFFYILLTLPFVVISQSIKLSPKAEISLITCGPGEELVSSFGHTAFRVKDPTLNLDIAYNYGVYDFDTPNFYTKFAQGKLLYQLSVYKFEHFIYSYQSEQRWVKAQVLNLSLEEKNKLFHFLNNNAKPDNKYYLYDFFFDNCSTRPRDVLEQVLANNIKFSNSHIKEERTFRELIQLNLNKNTWGSFGIDMALGSFIDEKATPYQHMYLPNYLMYSFDSATYKNKPLVKKTVDVLKSDKDFTQQSYFLLSPGFLFSILMIVVLLITYFNFKQNKRNKWVDFSLFFITGVLGIFILLLWFATDHTMTKNNFQFLWVFPANIVVSFFILKKNVKKWIEKYVLFLLALIGVTVILWLFKIQEFPIVIIPILIMLTIRYLYLIKFFRTK